MTSPAQLDPVSDTNDDIEDIVGVISTDDEDAYQRKIVDDWWGSVGPIASTVSPNVQLCLFLKCSEEGPVEISECQNGSVYLKYSDDIQGCCGTSIKIAFSCPGANDTLQTYTRIRSTAPQCEPYTINFGQ